MKYVKLEHEVNLETIGNARNMGKKKIQLLQLKVYIRREWIL